MWCKRRLNVTGFRPCGLMKRALVFGTADCRFESWDGHFGALLQRSKQRIEISRTKHEPEAPNATNAADFGTARSDTTKWTHRGLKPRPSACGAAMIPLHHVSVKHVNISLNERNNKDTTTQLRFHPPDSNPRCPGEGRLT